jgi:arabinogalactan endo-1,4-beta-galactosidase
MVSQGVVYKDSTLTNPVAENVLTMAVAHGYSIMRARLWVNPSETQVYVSNLAYDEALGAQIKAAGLKFYLDMHMSDTWADAGEQVMPAAWAGITTQAALVQQVHDYTESVITACAATNAMPDYVAVGNEITDGMLYPATTGGPGGNITTNGWADFAALESAGIQGVDDGAALAGQTVPKIIVHIDRGGDWATTQWYFTNLNAQGVKYDIIGESYYPQYHGLIANAQTCLPNAASTFGKPVYVAETGYPDEGGTPTADEAYPLTPAGQNTFLAALVALVQGIPNGQGMGIMYWEPEWLQSVGGYPAWPEPLFNPATGLSYPGLATLGGK